jgi:NitT/TauT family transport system substrate-binding protein
MRKLEYVVAAVVAVWAMTPQAMAEDTLKVAVARQGAWDTAVADLGQRAGIFKKHGLTLDLTYPRAEDTIEPAVISGSADVGLGVGIVDVLRAYATKSAPIRIIGANMTGSANYWYVAATSPIKTVKDINGKTIAYSKADASSQYDVFDFVQRYGVKARPVLIAGATPTFDQVMAGRSMSAGRRPVRRRCPRAGGIRVLAKANDIPKIRDKTDSVTIVTADTLQKRRDVVDRFVQAYRDTSSGCIRIRPRSRPMPSSRACPKRSHAACATTSTPRTCCRRTASSADAISRRRQGPANLGAAVAQTDGRALVQIPAPLRANASAKAADGFGHSRQGRRNLAIDCGRGSRMRKLRAAFHACGRIASRHRAQSRGSESGDARVAIALPSPSPDSPYSATAVAIPRWNQAWNGNPIGVILVVGAVETKAMRWDELPRSDNVEDRRADGGPRGMPMGRTGGIGIGTWSSCA